MIKKMNYCLGLEETNGVSFGFQTVLCSWMDNYQRTQFELSSVVAAKLLVWTIFVLSQDRQKQGLITSQSSWEIPRGLRSWGSGPQAQRKAGSYISKECQACLSIKAGGSFGQREVTLIIEIPVVYDLHKAISPGRWGEVVTSTLCLSWSINRVVNAVLGHGWLVLLSINYCLSASPEHPASIGSSPDTAGQLLGNSPSPSGPQASIYKELDQIRGSCTSHYQSPLPFISLWMCLVLFWTIS